MFCENMTKLKENKYFITQELGLLYGEKCFVTSL